MHTDCRSTPSARRHSMPAFADLHLHSRFSDGLCAPAELVDQARAAGYAAIAVTDHDTIEGTTEALAAGEKLGVEVIAGVEITCCLGSQEVHLLGYFFGDTWQDGALHRVLDHARLVRVQRIGEIVGRLNQLGVRLTVDEVLACSTCGVLGRPHVAMALQKRGIVTSVEEAFDRFLKSGRPAYVERYRMAAAEAIGHVRRAGGLAVLAHPGLQSAADPHIREMADQGLAGLEVWHPQHAPAQIKRYRKLADELGLVATGGSDTHATLTGTVHLPYAQVDALKQRAARRR